MNENIFSIGMVVEYNNMHGFIDFICDRYIVIQLPPYKDRKPPRLCVFREYWKDISIMKDKV